MDISFYSLFLFIITTLLYISSVPVIGKPKLMLVKNSLSETDLGEYYSESMKKWVCFY
jgi:hypothetical protein